MTTDRQFTHPNFGKQARVELDGREVRLIFVASDAGAAESLADSILAQLRDGALNITLMGKPTSVVEKINERRQIEMNIRRMIPLGTHLRRCVVCGAQINAKSADPTVHELACMEKLVEIHMTPVVLPLWFGGVTGISNVIDISAVKAFRLLSGTRALLVPQDEPREFGVVVEQ
jgi:hypothetical protein